MISSLWKLITLVFVVIFAYLLVSFLIPWWYLHYFHPCLLHGACFQPTTDNSRGSPLTLKSPSGSNVQRSPLASTMLGMDNDGIAMTSTAILTEDSNSRDLSDHYIQNKATSLGAEMSPNTSKDGGKTFFRSFGLPFRSSTSQSMVDTTEDNEEHHSLLPSSNGMDSSMIYHNNSSISVWMEGERSRNRSRSSSSSHNYTNSSFGNNSSWYPSNTTSSSTSNTAITPYNDGNSHHNYSASTINITPGNSSSITTTTITTIIAAAATSAAVIADAPRNYLDHSSLTTGYGKSSRGNNRTINLPWYSYHHPDLMKTCFLCLPQFAFTNRMGGYALLLVFLTVFIQLFYL